MEKERVIKKAEKLGITTSSSNSLEKLEEIAHQLGLENFNPLSDIKMLEDVLDAELANSTEEFLDTEEMPQEEYLEEVPSSVSDYRDELPQSTEDEKTNDDPEKTKNEKQPDDLKKEEQEKKKEESPDSKKNDPSEEVNKKPDGQQNKNIKDNNNLKKDQTKDALSKPKRQNQQSQNFGKQKNSLLPGEKVTKAKPNNFFDSLKNKFLKPNAGKGKGLKDLGKSIANIGKTIFSFLKAHPMVLIVIVFILLFIIILFFVLFFFMDSDGNSSASSSNNSSVGYYDSKCNFNDVKVIYQEQRNGESQSDYLDDFVKKIAYNNVNSGTLSDDQLKAYLIMLKTNVLSLGTYNSDDNTITCNESVQEIDNPDQGIEERINDIYTSVSEQLYLSKDFTGTFKDLTENNAVIIDFATLSSSTGNYEEVLKEMYSSDNYEIYNLEDNCTFYTVTENDAYWWPIGSASPTNGNIYGGEPVTINVSSKYGMRDHPIDNVRKMHNGIDISDKKDNCGEVIIAAKSGTVTGTKFEKNGFGYYVVIDHGDGIKTRYAHMQADSFAVSVGDKVVQGQKIGLVGTTGKSTGCHLHFEVVVNGKRVDPLNYVSTDNPRGVNKYSLAPVNDAVTGKDDVKQEICRVFLKSGFSENSVAGMLVNIQVEGSFKTNNLEGCYEENRCCKNGTYGFCKHPEITGFGSDELYTSGVDSGAYPRDKFISDRAGYGLIQWTSKGRKTGLYDYVKSQNKSIGSLSGQLGYLLEELKEYPKTYKYVTGNYSAYDIANNFCLDFERPSNKEVGCPRRANNYSSTMLTYVQNGCSD